MLAHAQGWEAWHLVQSVRANAAQIVHVSARSKCLLQHSLRWCRFLGCHQGHTLSAARGPISLGSDGFALQAVNQAVSNMTQMTQGAASTMPAPQLNGVARCLAFCEGSWLPAYLRAVCMFRRLHILDKVVGRCCMLWVELIKSRINIGNLKSITFLDPRCSSGRMAPCFRHACRGEWERHTYKIHQDPTIASGNTQAKFRNWTGETCIILYQWLGAVRLLLGVASIKCRILWDHVQEGWTSFIFFHISQVQDVAFKTAPDLTWFDRLICVKTEGQWTHPSLNCASAQAVAPRLGMDSWSSISWSVVGSWHVQSFALISYSSYSHLQTWVNRTWNRFWAKLTASVLTAGSSDG